MEESFFGKLKALVILYSPLIVVTLFSLFLSLGFMRAPHEFAYRFMGFFLVIFSLFKWIDIKGFMAAFAEYDLVSKFFKPYLIIYPALEFMIGYSYLQMDFLLICNILTIAIMGINGISVGKALINKKKINCACLGTSVKLPLTVVSIFESILMLTMAAMML